MKKILAITTILCVILLAQLLLSFSDKGQFENYSYHSKRERNHFNNLAKVLPTGFNSIFAASGECELCHGTAGAGPNTTALQDALGNDVSPVADWKGTMMANSAKDPFWRAKVSHEVLVNPNLQTAIENTCTRCHAPNGFFNAIHNGEPHYLISDLEQDSIGLDGVSCTSCHSMLPNGLGSVFSAGMQYDTTKTIYGPYDAPVANPMINNIGFTPTKGDHINDAGLCGICHTLITHPVDLSGNPLGTDFVEQAIYQEWQNSEFSSSNLKTCQDCHVPRTNDNVVISDRPTWLDPRTPFGKHYLVGGNAFMLSLLKDNIDTLGLSAEPADFDKAISRTINQLQNNTLNINLTDDGRDLNNAYFKIELENLTGHKFPSGYPSRRAYVEFIVQNTSGDTIFHSGKTDDDYRLIEENATYEYHYDTINSESQVQIYEMVMGDINSNVTTVLERAYSHLKDNRLPPVGFTSSHFSYDTVKVIGNALTDINFNKISGVEGSGKDAIYFKIPLNGYNGSLNVSANIYYQSVPPKWTDEMFSLSSTEIDLFKHLYNNADHTPILVASATLNQVDIEEIESNPFVIYPNPTSSFVKIEGLNNINKIVLFSNEGKMIQNFIWNGTSNQQIKLPERKGIYYIKITTKQGKSFSKKILHY
ncbi:MAG: T9SS type A sorting domain-containing protein [Flavobacteriales bacterium]|nr:T9SS type A sorting domain-containing protein [Flavobacteriales bacterium]MCB9336355.1 T9SS type A sorting domain-containing protein [Flavobacteriales bacterium]